MRASMLRTAHALGFPVVPEVYISAVRSFGVRFAGWSPDGENCWRLSAVTSSTDPVDRSLKEERLKAKCGMSTQTCCDRSGVEMIDLEPETLRQWMKVSPWTCQLL